MTIASILVIKQNNSFQITGNKKVQQNQERNSLATNYIYQSQALTKIIENSEQLIYLKIQHQVFPPVSLQQIKQPLQNPLFDMSVHSIRQHTDNRDSRLVVPPNQYSPQNSSSSIQKKVLISQNDNFLKIPNQQQQQQYQQQQQQQQQHLLSRKMDQSSSSNKSSTKGILKTVKKPSNLREGSFDLDLKSSIDVSSQIKQGQRAQSEQHGYNFERTQIKPSKDRYFLQQTTEKKELQDDLLSLRSSDINFKEKKQNNDQSIVFSPLKQKVMGSNTSTIQNYEDGPLISVNDRIPFKVDNKNGNTQELNNNLPRQDRDDRSEVRGQPQANSQNDKFVHSSTYLKSRLIQIDNNKQKPVNNLPFVNEDSNYKNNPNTALGYETIHNPLSPPTQEANPATRRNQSSNPVIVVSTPQTQRRSNNNNNSNNNSNNNINNNNYNNINNSIISSIDNLHNMNNINKNMSNYNQQSPQNYYTPQRINTFNKQLNLSVEYPHTETHAKNQGFHNYSFQDNIVTQNEEINRKKHRLLERLKKGTSPNQFHYSEHYDNDAEDERYNYQGPFPPTHPMRNKYDTNNPLRAFQIKSNIPLANQNYVTDPQTYTHQVFCHANQKRQKNQERMIGLLEQQDKMMNRLITKYKKRAEQEEQSLQKKLLALEKDRDQLVELKNQEQKLTHLQSNFTSKLDQFKKNTSFYNDRISPKMPVLKPNMYDQQTDMYDLAFLDSILNQNQLFAKGVKRNVLQKKRSQSTLN